MDMPSARLGGSNSGLDLIDLGEVHDLVRTGSADSEHGRLEKEKGKKLGHCRECHGFLRGAIRESESPRPRQKPRIQLISGDKRP
jgi:hypothetical protein